MKILLSGFEPFNKHINNPSEQLVNMLVTENSTVFDFLGITLPVTFKDAFPLLKKQIEDYRPDYVICFGLAENRKDISLEQIAVNLNNAKIPDNSGYKPINQKIKSDGKDQLRSSLPNEMWLKIAQEKNYPVSLSQSAGTYVCNNVMYQVIDEALNKQFRAGFIHISKELDIKLIKEVIMTLLKGLKKD